MVNARLTKLGLRFAIGGAAAFLAARVEAVPVSVSMGVLLLAAGIGFVSLAFEAQTEGKGMIPLLLGLVAWVTGTCLLIWPSMTVVTLVALLGNVFDLEWFDDSRVRLAAPSDHEVGPGFFWLAWSLFYWQVARGFNSRYRVPRRRHPWSDSTSWRWAERWSPCRR